MEFPISKALECGIHPKVKKKQCLCMHRRWLQTGDDLSVAEDDIHDVSDEIADGVDDIALASVNDALDAVENEEQQLDATLRNLHLQRRGTSSPSGDVEDPEEMVEVLLTVGEERSRRNDVKGPCSLQ